MVNILAALLITAVFAHIVLTWFRAVKQGLHARQHKQAQPDIVQMDKYPSVSILIPAWNEQSILEHSISSLDQMDYPDWEAVVIAGGTDNTWEIASRLCSQRPNFKAVEQPPLGKNAALNRGLSHAGGEVIVILDADSMVQPDWLKQMVQPLMNGADAVTGSFSPYEDTDITRCDEMERIAAYEIHRATTLQGSGGIALWRSVIHKIGGFPEEIPVGVDWDLNLRVIQHGLTSAYAPQAKLRTERPSTLYQFWRNEVRWRRAHLSLTLYHSRPHDPMAFLLAYRYYIVTGVLVLSMLGTVFSAFFLPDLFPFIAFFTGLLVGWVALRKAALAGMIAAYKQDAGWLRLAPLMTFLLFVTMFAACRAVMTLSRRSIHFKGQRTAFEKAQKLS